MSYEITLCARKNTRDLDFSIGGNRKTELGNVSFVVSREIIEAEDKTGSQELPSTIRFRGMFYPKDVESADMLLQHCLGVILLPFTGDSRMLLQKTTPITPLPTSCFKRYNSTAHKGGLS